MFAQFRGGEGRIAANYGEVTKSANLRGRRSAAPAVAKMNAVSHHCYNLGYILFGSFIGVDAMLGSTNTISSFVQGITKETFPGLVKI